MQLYVLLVVCVVSINQTSCQDYEKALHQYRKSYSVYDQDNVFKLYKAVSSAMIKYYQTKYVTKDFLLHSVRQYDLWTQSVLKDRFIRVDSDRDGVMEDKDFNYYIRYVIFSDLLASGTDANNDYTVTRKEYKQFVSTFNPNQEWELAFNLLFKDLDFNHDQIFNTNDFLACR
ncbi:uncharacterized protein LOC106053076 [Biomphalaria glabrata]|uniref:Uncharacterized protein LOC106053076 n=1 Tax=Biomphalaria glabrata TaxID=6526 RepID=A0A9W2YVP2_BIOGL|nr:uncharacterized protein LOC106053076 [Biomphalaria glabrata]XP_055866791.1 uncharacterized protein LOC106053076 [Biomphalaria glabrata]